MLKKKNLSKIFLILLLFIIGTANVKADFSKYASINYTHIFSTAEEFCAVNDVGLSKIGSKTLSQIQEELNEYNNDLRNCGQITNQLDKSKCYQEVVKDLNSLYSQCPVENSNVTDSCRDCIGIDMTLPSTDPSLKQRCTKDPCKSWILNYCNATGQASSVEECKTRCECRSTEELRESCKKQCEIEWTEKDEDSQDNNQGNEQGNEQGGSNIGDLDFSEKNGCDALGGLAEIIRDIYKMIRIFLSVLLFIVTMMDYAKVVIDNSDFKNFKKANKNFAVRIGIIVVLYLLPELINFLLNAIGLGEYFCW